MQKRLRSLIRAFTRGSLRYEWRYRWGRTPWETERVPPEVMAFIKKTPPGKALDLGCGTGTHAIALARHGWRVTGIDFSFEAIRKARLKAERAGIIIDFYAADVTGPGLRPHSVDYVLDIGCLYSLKEKDRMPYAQMLAGCVGPKGCYMLFSWLPRRRRGRIAGISTEEAGALFQENFIPVCIRLGEEKGYPCAWYWFERRCEASTRYDNP